MSNLIYGELGGSKGEYPDRYKFMKELIEGNTKKFSGDRATISEDVEFKINDDSIFIFTKGKIIGHINNAVKAKLSPIYKNQGYNVMPLNDVYEVVSNATQVDVRLIMVHHVCPIIEFIIQS